MSYLQRHDSVLNLCLWTQLSFLLLPHGSINLTYPFSYRQTIFISKWCTPLHKKKKKRQTVLFFSPKYLALRRDICCRQILGLRNLNTLKFIPLHHLEAHESICGLSHLMLPCKLMSSWFIDMQVIALLLRLLHPFCSWKGRKLTTRTVVVPSISSHLYSLLQRTCTACQIPHCCLE